MTAASLSGRKGCDIVIFFFLSQMTSNKHVYILESYKCVIYKYTLYDAKSLHSTSENTINDTE